jgi:hypothetical protein
VRKTAAPHVYAGTALVALALCISVSATHAAINLPAGVDCWQTMPVTTAHIDLPANALMAPGRTSLAFVADIPVTGVTLPENTCNCADQAEIQWLDRHGNPVQTGDQHAVTQAKIQNPYDTCVQRGASVLSTINTTVPVPIEIVALHLRSVNPVSIPMNPGPNCLYQVDITLNGAQAGGTLNLTPRQADLAKGDATVQSLPVGYRIDFTPLAGCNPGSRTASLTFTNNNGKYGIPGFPTLNAWGTGVLIAALLAAMTYLWWRRRQPEGATS